MLRPVSGLRPGDGPDARLGIGANAAIFSVVDAMLVEFSGFGAIWANSAGLNGEADPEQVRIGFVTTDFFSVLGADAARGRTFNSGDGDGAEPRILLSAGFLGLAAVLASWSAARRATAAGPLEALRAD